MASASGVKAGEAFVELHANDSRLVKGLNAAAKRLKAWGASMTATGQKMLFGAAAAGAPMAMATATFMGFEDQMKAVQAVTGATGAEFQKLYEKAKLLGRTTSFTAAEVAAGMLNLARAGFSTDEIDAAIAGMLNLARATGTDLALACDIAAGTLRAFGLEANQADRVADVLVATANNSAQTLEDLGESMKYVAPIAEEYGLSLEETAKALGVLANMQIKGSMAGTSLRQAMLQLTDPEVQRQIETLGVRVKDVSGNLRSDFGSMLLELGRAMQGMTNAQRLALFKALFDQRAAASMAKLAKSDFPALAEAIEKSGGVAAKTAQIMDSGLGGGFRRMMSALEGVKIAIGESLNEALKQAADWLMNACDKLTQWIAANQQAVVIAAAVIAGVAGIGLSFLVLGGILSGLGTAFGLLGGVLTAVGTAFGVIKMAIGALLTPIGLVVGALTALGGYLLYTSGVGEGALSWLGEQFRSLRDTAIAAWKGIGDALAAGDIGLAAKVLWLTLKMKWLEGINGLNEKWIGFKEAFQAVATEAIYGVARIFTSAWAWLQTAWVETVAAMSSAWTYFTHHVVTGWRTAQNWISKKFVQLMGLFDSSVDVEGAMKILDEDFAREQAQRDKATQEQLASIEATRQAKRKAIDEEESGTLAILEEERQKRHVDRKKQYDRDLQATKEAADQARKEWEESLAAAAKKREEAEAAGVTGPGKAKKPGDLAKAAGIAGIEAATRSVSIVGTFGPWAVGGLATGNPMERTARATEETAKNTRKIAQQAKQGGLVFA